MKHLRSSLGHLHEVFERGITARYIAEPLVAFDDLRDVSETRSYMEDKDFDIVGVRRQGSVVGFVRRTELRTGMLRDFIHPFAEDSILDDRQPMTDALKVLAKYPHVFVVVMGEVSGIIMKGDLQKAPLRMWLFGLVSLLEMQFLRLIRSVYPAESWTELLSASRISDAKEILVERRRRNEAIDLADCLQLCDKRTILLKGNLLLPFSPFSTKGTLEKFLKKVESLRDELAHSQDIITGQWPELVELVTNVEELLAACEAVEVKNLAKSDV